WRYGHKASTEELTVRFQPRYLSSEKRYQFPPRYYVIAPSSDEIEVRTRHVAAIEAFLVQVASPSHALHGAIGAATDADLAYNEVTMQPEPGFGPDGKPVRGRLWFDQGRWEEAWTLARRAYWTTILGPDLVAATGGIEAARSTGAARVEMRSGCLVVQSTSDVNDYLSPGWPERALPIRRWLWPHTIQNPFDDPDRPLARSDEVST
ncbi:MAG: hypothetical protein HOV81_37615, partial [Kofleriaceae bacterium]|nr:hypothetical protein [Kofleriaceae bacterium]